MLKLKTKEKPAVGKAELKSMQKAREGELEHWQAALDDLLTQRDQLKAEGEKLQADLSAYQENAKDPRASFSAAEAGQKSAAVTANRQTLSILDDRIAAVRLSVAEAQKEVNTVAILDAHRAERAQYEKVMDAWRELLGEVDALEVVYRQLGALGDGPHTGFLPNAIRLLRAQIETWERHDPFGKYVNW